jgi:hypothetical protein
MYLAQETNRLLLPGENIKKELRGDSYNSLLPFVHPIRFCVFLTASVV